MAQLFAGQTFDANQVDPTPHFAAIPAGDYHVIVTASELKFTKDGAGQYLELQHEVQDGPHRGAKLWNRLNIHNSNQRAVEIAQRTLSQLCHAVGVLQVSDSEQLHFKPCIAVVSVRVDAGREPSNDIKGYKAMSGAPVAAAAPFAAPRATASAPAAPGFAPSPATTAAPFPPASPVSGFTPPPGFGAGAAAPWLTKAA